MVRIVQLTDLHLTADGRARAWRSDVWGSFRRALRALEALEPLDRLVLTGDLVNQRRAETYARLAEALQPWWSRLLVVPGNHDHRELCRAAFADRFVAGRPTLNFDDVCGDTRLLGLDSLWRGRVVGRLGKEQLRWLETALASADLPVLVFVHHPPVRVGCWWLDKDILRDRAALAAIVHRSPVRVEAIFTGHVHQQLLGQLEGVPVHTTPSTAYQFPPRARRPHAVQRGQPGFRLIEVDAGLYRTAVVYPVENQSLEWSVNTTAAETSSNSDSARDRDS